MLTRQEKGSEFDVGDGRDVTVPGAALPQKSLRDFYVPIDARSVLINTGLQPGDSSGSFMSSNRFNGFRAQTVETVRKFLALTNTGLKPGINENAPRMDKNF